MKCPYQTDIDCRYVDTAFMNVEKTCIECELYDPHNPNKGGCLESTGKIAVAVIIILILLLI